ncbi:MULTISPECIES: hypothetical protein [Actinoalloteichus]|uniref:Uncharacterized protein n=1 Tax=Actinoalloteichus fjordicus TaxID=1612552 RepID=A0AAC9LIF3_9PSEU|nr:MULTISPECIES: hypothetical protein [Actinoalloteichus]APU17475.1 hypothetical protein UA74_27360 [Actinoalloteichus fjordicus]APU23552.1 hypothetical protein UA75_27905 [Actinoalloteichus sp. GBA129-24]
MSVIDVVTELRRAHALLVDALAATAHAEQAIDDGTTTFDTATTGSTQPAVESARHCALAATNDIHAARTALLAAQNILDAYCREIAGHGIIDDTTITDRHPETEPHDIATRPIQRPDAPAERYGAEITELQRGGAKISPDRVVRAARHQRGHLVWLELGHEGSSGQAHIVRSKRTREFGNYGIPRHRIIDVIFDCLEHGDQVGTLDDGEVYEVECGDGEKRPITIVVADNGYIVTAYPIGRRRYTL